MSVPLNVVGHKNYGGASYLLNPVIHPAAGLSDPNYPVSPVAPGGVYFDTTTPIGPVAQHFRGWDGSAWFVIPRTDYGETVTGQWYFNPASGSPFTVASQTQVNNLNAQFTGGYAPDTNASANSLAARTATATLLVGNTSGGNSGNEAVNWNTALTLLNRGIEKAAARVATTTTLPAYTATSTTLTMTANGQLTVDGVALVLNDRILVLYEGSGGAPPNLGGLGANNGIFYVSQQGGVGAPAILTRTADAIDSSTLTTGDSIFVDSGTVNGGSTWALLTQGTITPGTTAIQWTKTGGSQLYQAGNGIVINGNQVSFAQSASYTANSLPYASGASTVGFIAPANSGVLVSSNTGAPQMLSAGTVGQLLQAASTPSWTTAVYPSDAVLGDLIYATAAHVIGRLPIGTAGFFVQVNSGGTAPQWFNLFGTANTWTNGQTFQNGISIGASSPAGSVLFVGAGGSVSQNNANFYWDNTNDILQLNGATVPTLQATAYSNTASNYGSVLLGHARGTASLPSALASGDWLGSISFRGYGTSTWPTGAYISAVAASAFTDTSAQTSLNFYTAASGSVSAQLVLSLATTAVSLSSNLQLNPIAETLISKPKVSSSSNWIDIDLDSDATYTAGVQFFRAASGAMTGNPYLYVHKGDGTFNPSFIVNGAGGSMRVGPGCSAADLGSGVAQLYGGLTFAGSQTIATTANGILTLAPNGSGLVYMMTNGTATTAASNVAASLRSLASGRDVCIQFSDNVTNTAYVGMVGGAAYIQSHNGSTWTVLGSGANTLQATGAGVIATTANGNLTLAPNGTGNVVVSTLTANEFVVTDPSNNLASFNLFGTANTWTGIQTFSAVPVCSTNPTSSNQLANKAYVDLIGTGLRVKLPCRVATAAALPANTATSTTLTMNAVGVLTVDGVSTVLNDRILVNNEATAANNGLYYVSTQGTSGVAAVLTRTADATSASDLTIGCYTFITSGTVNINTAWYEVDAVTTVGTSPVSFTLYFQVSGYLAGNGIGIVGQTISVDQTFNPNWTGHHTFSSASGLTLNPNGGATTVLQFVEPGPGTNYVGLRAPTSISTSTVWTLPSSDGTIDQCLQTNGSGVLQFAQVQFSQLGGTSNVVTSVVNDTNVTGAIASNVLTLGWSGQLAIARGGTGQSTAAAAFNALSPMTAIGDLIYGGALGYGTRLGGNTQANTLFLSSTGTGTAAQAPSWFNLFGTANTWASGQTFTTAAKVQETASNTSADAADILFVPGNAPSSTAVEYLISLRDNDAVAGQANSLLFYDYDGTTNHSYLELIYNGGSPIVQAYQTLRLSYSTASSALVLDASKNVVAGPPIPSGAAVARVFGPHQLTGGAMTEQVTHGLGSKVVGISLLNYTTGNYIEADYTRVDDNNIIIDATASTIPAASGLNGWWVSVFA